jgi:hypothetical protein
MIYAPVSRQKVTHSSFLGHIVVFYTWEQLSQVRRLGECLSKPVPVGLQNRHAKDT